MASAAVQSKGAAAGANAGGGGAAAAAAAVAAARRRGIGYGAPRGASAAAGAARGPPSLTLLSAGATTPTFLQKGGRRRRGDDSAAPFLRRCPSSPIAASAAAASGAGAVWPAATPADGSTPESADAAAAAAAASSSSQRGGVDLAASVAAAALERAAVQAEGDAAADLASSASFASASSASLPDESSAPSSSAAGEGEKPAGNNSGLTMRVGSGVLLGAAGAAVVAAGGIPFLLAALFVTYHATREFYGLLTSRGLSKGMTPPGPVVSASTTLLCMSIALLTHATARGRSGVAMAVAGFVLLSLNLFSSPKPKFAQLTSSLFGLFYCGYLPSFWIKLRAVAAPLPVDAPIVALLPAWLPQQAWAGGGATVGLAVTLTAVACVIAADTGAYFVGKSLGRTKLTDISPKKTVEGAFGGLLSSVGVALLLQATLTGWPAVPVAAAAAAGLHFPQAAVPWAAPLLAAAFGAAVFVSSILGDLIESIIKREAGLKDSGDLIPGHGGLLDRFDSYIFTGALAYGFVVFGHLF